jgi:protein SCO1/2
MKHRILIAFFFLLALAGCVKKQPEQTKPIKTYTINGVIKALDAEHHTATIEHQEIVGWMDAMTMEFPIRSVSDFAKLQVGQKITAKVNVQDLEFWLSEIQIQ